MGENSVKLGTGRGFRTAIFIALPLGYLVSDYVNSQEAEKRNEQKKVVELSINRKVDSLINRCRLIIYVAKHDSLNFNSKYTYRDFISLKKEIVSLNNSNFNHQKRYELNILLNKLWDTGQNFYGNFERDSVFKDEKGKRSYDDIQRILNEFRNSK